MYYCEDELVYNQMVLAHCKFQESKTILLDYYNTGAYEDLICSMEERQHDIFICNAISFNENEHSILHILVLKSQFELALRLVKLGANYLIRDARGNTACHYCSKAMKEAMIFARKSYLTSAGKQIVQNATDRKGDKWSQLWNQLTPNMF